MKIINNNQIIDDIKLIKILNQKKINFINKEIYFFVYDFIDILNLNFLNDINYFLSNKTDKDKNIIIIYQNINYSDNYELTKYEKLYIEILKNIKIKYSLIEFILYNV
tara:strand:+ start:1170 stop:1493 length:324 start_codon:yes stop_codon:yes gene_type:complete